MRLCPKQHKTKPSNPTMHTNNNQRGKTTTTTTKQEPRHTSDTDPGEFNSWTKYVCGFCCTFCIYYQFVQFAFMQPRLAWNLLCGWVQTMKPSSSFLHLPSADMAALWHYAVLCGAEAGAQGLLLVRRAPYPLSPNPSASFIHTYSNIKCNLGTKTNRHEH